MIDSICRGISAYALLNNSIISLKSRASRARRSALIIGLSISLIVAYTFTIVAYRYSADKENVFKNWPITSTNTSKSTYQDNDKPVWRMQKDGSPESIFDIRIEQILTGSLGREPNEIRDFLFSSKGQDDKNPAVKADYNPKLLEERLGPVLTAYERYNKARQFKSEKPQTSDESKYVSIISSLMLTIGVVGFIVLIIQTAVTFIRYYVRLAELYDAQADALEASDGDTEVAFHFIEKFSPLGIEFGKLPLSTYEKSFETILELAKSRK